MSKKTSKTTIGAFVLGAIALAVVGIVAFGGGRFFEKTVPVVINFDGSTKGLNVGAPIVLKGVEIGSVTSVDLQFDATSWEYRTSVRGTVYPSVKIVGARAQVEELERKRDDVRWMLGALVEKGMRAELGLQSFVTGMLQVELDIDENAEPAKLGQLEDGTWEIPTQPSDMERITRTLEKINFGEIAENIESVSSDIAKLSAKADERIARVETDLTEALEAATKLFEDIDKEFIPLAARLDEGLADVRELTRNLNAQVGPLSTSVSETLADTRELIATADSEIEPLSQSIKDAGRAATRTLDDARDTLALLKGRVPSDATLLTKVSTTLDSISAASDSMKALMTYLEQHPEALIKGKQ